MKDISHQLQHNIKAIPPFQFPKSCQLNRAPHHDTIYLQLMSSDYHDDILRKCLLENGIALLWLSMLSSSNHCFSLTVATTDVCLAYAILKPLYFLCQCPPGHRCSQTPTIGTIHWLLELLSSALHPSSIVVVFVIVAVVSHVLL